MQSLYDRVTRFFAAMAICLLAGYAGSTFTTAANLAWYADLTLPALTPSTWVFTPTWMVLYVLMGIALYMVWSKGWEQKGVKVAVGIFAVQLFLTVLWPYLFFGMQAPLLALMGIGVLWVAVLMTFGAFYRVSVPAAVLFIPYFFWVTFTAYLNYGIYTLNL